MLIKNISLGMIEYKDMSKIIFVKNCSIFERVFMFKSNDDYKCIFTKQRYSINSRSLIPITFILDNDDLKRSISKKKIRELYCKNEDALIKKLSMKTNTGFDMRG